MTDDGEAKREIARLTRLLRTFQDESDFLRGHRDELLAELGDMEEERDDLRKLAKVGVHPDTLPHAGCDCDQCERQRFADAERFRRGHEYHEP